MTSNYKILSELSDAEINKLYKVYSAMDGKHKNFKGTKREYCSTVAGLIDDFLNNAEKTVEHQSKLEGSGKESRKLKEKIIKAQRDAAPYASITNDALTEAKNKYDNLRNAFLNYNKAKREYDTKSSLPTLKELKAEQIRLLAAPVERLTIKKDKLPTESDDDFSIRQKQRIKEVNAYNRQKTILTNQIQTFAKTGRTAQLRSSNRVLKLLEHIAEDVPAYEVKIKAAKDAYNEQVSKGGDASKAFDKVENLKQQLTKRYDDKRGKIEALIKKYFPDEAAVFEPTAKTILGQYPHHMGKDDYDPLTKVRKSGRHFEGFKSLDPGLKERRYKEGEQFQVRNPFLLLDEETSFKGKTPSDKYEELQDKAYYYRKVIKGLTGDQIATKNFLISLQFKDILKLTPESEKTRQKFFSFLGRKGRGLYEARDPSKDWTVTDEAAYRTEKILYDKLFTPQGASLKQRVINAYQNVGKLFSLKQKYLHVDYKTPTFVGDSKGQITNDKIETGTTKKLVIGWEKLLHIIFESAYVDSDGKLNITNPTALFTCYKSNESVNSYNEDLPNSKLPLEIVFSLELEPILKSASNSTVRTGKKEELDIITRSKFVDNIIEYVKKLKTIDPVTKVVTDIKDLRPTEIDALVTNPKNIEFLRDLFSTYFGFTTFGAVGDAKNFEILLDNPKFHKNLNVVLWSKKLFDSTSDAPPSVQDYVDLYTSERIAEFGGDTIDNFGVNQVLKEQWANPLKVPEPEVEGFSDSDEEEEMPSIPEMKKRMLDSGYLAPRWFNRTKRTNQEIIKEYKDYLEEEEEEAATRAVPVAVRPTPTGATSLPPGVVIDPDTGLPMSMASSGTVGTLPVATASALTTAPSDSAKLIGFTGLDPTTTLSYDQLKDAAIKHYDSLTSNQQASLDPYVRALIGKGKPKAYKKKVIKYY